jgi:hypothetical protein
MLEPRMNRILICIALLACAACSGHNDNGHTTATTIVSPPPRQVLRAEFRPAPEPPSIRPDYIFPGKNYDREKPILVFDMANAKTFREGEPIVIEFTLLNGDLKDDGGEYRLRYIVDDDDMQWIDRVGQVWLWGWLPGKHTIRLELVGPDGWPARNGDFNVETREILVSK